jgi:acetylornithine/N-succinyldiaminopimelate aminotransferase
MTAGTHGSTYGGNPLAMAVGNAVLDLIEKPGFLKRVADASTLMRQKLARLKDETGGVIEEVRGTGLMLGLKCTVPNTDLVKALRERHMLAAAAGDNVVRLLPPLIVSDAEIDEAAGKIAAACAALAPQVQAPAAHP